jgi:hypothetical protein
LEAYLDEALSADEMALVESALRADRDLTRRLAAINGRRDAGLHTLGEIWRRHRISCPAREQLGSYLLGALNKETRDYLEFHLKTVGCRFCLASLEDLERRHKETRESAASRHRKYLDSSAGYLRPQS